LIVGIATPPGNAFRVPCVETSTLVEEVFVTQGRPFVLFSLLAAAICAPASAQSPPGPVAPQPGVTVQAPPPQADFKVRVALVNTPATVRNSKGEMIHDLEARDFRVTDNGVPQQITHFDLGGDPLSFVVLIENSSQVEPLLPEVRKSGILVSQTVMGPNAEAAVLAFNEYTETLQQFTTNGDAVEKSIARLKTGVAGNKLYDSMARAVEMLSGRPEPTPDSPGRRRILLVIAEAKDVGSDAKLGEVLRQAQLANVTIYSVGLSTTRAELQAKPKDTRPHITPPGTFGRPPMPGTVQTPDTDAALYGEGSLMDAVVWAVKHVQDALKDNPLEIATAGTGGAHLATFRDRSIENAIDAIGGELHSQYSLTYTPTDTGSTGYHEIKIMVDKKNLKVRARPGYYVAEN
jgi:VWFA-related protein